MSEFEDQAKEHLAALLPYVEKILTALGRPGELVTRRTLIADFLPKRWSGDTTMRWGKRGMSIDRKEALDENPLPKLEKELGTYIGPGETVMSVAQRLKSLAEIRSSEYYKKIKEEFDRILKFPEGKESVETGVRFVEPISEPKSQNECDHGVRFDEEEADRVLGAWVPGDDADFIMGNPAAAEIRKRWPRLSGPCPKGCGFSGIAYASMSHYIKGDW